MTDPRAARPLTVVAIGGNSLLDPDSPVTVGGQFDACKRAMGPVAELIARGERLVLTHGNGPQVGFLHLRSELSRGVLHEVPLDSLVADTQGSIGYMIQRSLRAELERRGIDMPIASVVTEVEVDPHDTAFEEPTKPIGRFYSQEEADRLGAEHGWPMFSDAGRGWRRVVPSPSPKRIVQLETIRTLVEAGCLVVCCGGGGVPVVHDGPGQIRGLEAVIDKDRASALLALGLEAPRLMVTTGVDVVYKDFLSADPIPLPELTVADLRRLGAQGQFPPGSMRPKMEASIFYLNRADAFGGGEVLVTSPDRLLDAIDGETGTRIRRGA